MQTSEDNTSIQVYPIVPPLSGGYGFGAKAIVYDRKSGENITLHEHWGRSAEEAREKAELEAAEWLEVERLPALPVGETGG